MILSVSRRTDIPNYYSQWFYERIKEGFLYVKNPMNPHQVSKINLSPKVIDCIVFWTKNPQAMLPRLSELEEYPYYFQFTLTGYGKDIEPGLPGKRDCLLSVFRELSSLIGPQRVIWRYDPILINHKYTLEYHLCAFAEIAESLRGFTNRVVISFLDIYPKIKKSLAALQTEDFTRPLIACLAKEMAGIATANQMTIQSCAEKMDLQKFGIANGSCIDKHLIEEIIGCRLKGAKDPGQREACGCMESVEVGAYNTCLNGCRYCYANFSRESVEANSALYDVHSPLLCAKLQEGDLITERRMKSLKEEQLSLFDLFDAKER